MSEILQQMLLQQIDLRNALDGPADPSCQYGDWGDDHQIHRTLTCRMLRHSTGWRESMADDMSRDAIRS